MRQINTVLWKAIEGSGLKRWCLAERCGISPKKLAQIVRGFSEVDNELKVRIARELRQSIETIFPPNP